MFGDRKPIPIAVGPFRELYPYFSPDGKWVAYQSNESGREEIYVQSFPVASGKFQVSNGGGADPSWRADGKEIYYRSADQKLMAVEIHAGETVQGRNPEGRSSRRESSRASPATSTSPRPRRTVS